MRVIGLDDDVFGAEIKERCDFGVERQPGQGTRRPGELQAGLFEMVLIEMRIAKAMHEITRVEACHMRDHRSEKRIACDVERHSQKHIRRTLVELA